jgi:hypothetical protein
VAAAAVVAVVVVAVEKEEEEEGQLKRIAVATEGSISQFNRTYAYAALCVYCTGLIALAFKF